MKETGRGISKKGEVEVHHHQAHCAMWRRRRCALSILLRKHPTHDVVKLPVYRIRLRPPLSCTAVLALRYLHRAPERCGASSMHLVGGTAHHTQVPAHSARAAQHSAAPTAPTHHSAPTAPTAHSTAQQHPHSTCRTGRNGCRTLWQGNSCPAQHMPHSTAQRQHSPA